MAVRSAVQFRECDGRVVGERVHLQVGPEVLGRVELGRVWREIDEVDAAVSSMKPRLGRSVNIQSIPDDQDRCTDLAAEPPQEGQHLLGIDVFVWQERKVKSHLLATRRDGQSGNHRDPLTRASALIQDRSLADWRPGPSDKRRHEQSTLVQEDQGCLQPPGVFFTLGQTS